MYLSKWLDGSGNYLQEVSFTCLNKDWIFSLLSYQGPDLSHIILVSLKNPSVLFACMLSLRVKIFLAGKLHLVPWSLFL